VITAGFDPLRAEGRAYADALEAAGVSVTYKNYEGVIHGFVNMAGLMPAARAAYDDMVNTFRALLHG
jgi:acetyl esterase